MAPFILYTLNNKLIGSVVFLTLIFLGSIASVIPKYFFNLPVAPFEISSMMSVAQAKLSFIHYFAATDQLFVVFICGLFIGYLIKCKPDINLGKTFTNLVLWVGMLCLPLITTNWNEGFKPLEGNFSQFSFVSWFVLSKIMWAVGFGWVMFACTTNRAGKTIFPHRLGDFNFLSPTDFLFYHRSIRGLLQVALDSTLHKTGIWCVHQPHYHFKLPTIIQKRHQSSDAR